MKKERKEIKKERKFYHPEGQENINMMLVAFIILLAMLAALFK